LLTSKDGERVFNGFSERLTACLLHNRKALLEKIRLRQLLKQVRNTGYDHVFCFEQNPTFMPFYQAARKGGYCIDTKQRDVLYARRCLDAVAYATGKSLENYWLNLPVIQEFRHEVRTLFSSMGIDEDTFVVGLHPTYSGLKKWYGVAAWKRDVVGPQAPLQNWQHIWLPMQSIIISRCASSWI
jgi:hypothetical protein